MSSSQSPLSCSYPYPSPDPLGGSSTDTCPRTSVSNDTLSSHWSRNSQDPLGPHRRRRTHNPS